MPSTFLNLMRRAKETFNCSVSFSGTTITVAPYLGGNTASATSPLLARFTPDKASEVLSNLTFNFSAATFGIGNVSGITLAVGVQYLTDSTMQIVVTDVAVDADDITATVLAANATASGACAAPSAATQPICWLGKIINASRSGGAWSMVGASFIYGGSSAAR